MSPVPAAMVPQGFDGSVQVTPPTLVVSAQLTAVFVLLLTVAVNEAVCGGQLSAVSFGYRVDAVGLTLMLTGGVLLLPPPQAISKPSSPHSVGNCSQR